MAEKGTVVGDDDRWTVRFHVERDDPDEISGLSEQQADQIAAPWCARRFYKSNVKRPTPQRLEPLSRLGGQTAWIAR